MEIIKHFIATLLYLIAIQQCRCGSLPDTFQSAGSSAPKMTPAIIDISTYSSNNNFQMFPVEMHGIDSMLLFPNKGIAIQAIYDRTTKLWQSQNGEQFLMGLISAMPESPEFALNFILKAKTGIRFLMYEHKNDVYNAIDASTYIDFISKMRINDQKGEFTIDLSKTITQYSIDQTVMLGPYKIFTIIPSRGHISRKVINGDELIYDGARNDTSVPIIVTFQANDRKYMNLFACPDNSDMGTIYCYQISGNKVMYISKVDFVPFYKVFTYNLNNLPTPREQKRHSDKIDELDDLSLPRIAFDITNYDEQYISIQRMKVINMKTTKYLPKNSIITSVLYYGKPIWEQNKDEVKCVQVMVHSVNNVNQAVELSIMKQSNRIISKIIPFKVLSEYEAQAEEAEKETFEPDRLALTEVRSTKSSTGTPPPSPAKPAAKKYTPPPSPAASKYASTISLDSTKESTYSFDSAENVFRSPKKTKTPTWPGATKARSTAPREEFPYNSESEGSSRSGSPRSASVHGDYGYLEKKEKEDVLDLASSKSMEKVTFIDGTRYVPFVFLIPREGSPIRTVKYGPQTVWIVEGEQQALRYISMYMKNGKPYALALFIFQGHDIRTRYYVMCDGKFCEVNLVNYLDNTPYKFAGEPELILKRLAAEDEVVHVSLMVPVIIGTLFLVISVCSLLFIYFFC